MRRVVSKKLFSYPPQGKIDEDIKKNQPNLWSYSTFVINLIKYVSYWSFSRFLWPIEFKVKHQSSIEACLLMAKGYLLKQDEDFVKGWRIINNIGTDLVMSHSVYENGVRSCEHAELKVHTTHFGDYPVSVLVHTPKCLVNEKQRAAIIYAHGGGVVACKASTHKPYLSTLAVRCGVVIFNVDYRRAPETKCPNNILDFYEALKHIKYNAIDLGIDPNRIAIAGESGGGYICFGTMVLLSQRNESGMVKLAMPNIPMVDDDSFHEKKLTIGQTFQAAIIRKLWMLIAEDISRQKNDPLLFPGKATEHILENMPPTIVWEREFDMFINEASRLANRLQTAGRLLEFVVFPGQMHASNFNPNYKCYQMGMDAYNLAVKSYLIE